MNVLLVRPPEPRISRFYNKGESLGLGYLAAVLRQHGFEVEILDCVLLDWDHHRAMEEISKRDFAILGFAVFAVAMEEAANLASPLRERGCVAHITMGGHFPSFRAREILEEFPQFNSVVKFEGEYALLELAQAIKKEEDWSGIHGLILRDGNSVRVNPIREPIVDLDDLPFPARDMLPHALRWARDAYICTSRGCWAKCTYCSISPFSRKAGAPPWRARSPKNVVDEFEYLLRTFDPPAIGVVDADFIGPGRMGRRRAFAIADEILKRKLDFRFSIYTRVDEVEYELFEKLKAAGMTTVYLGIESGVQAALDRWRKHTTVEQNYRALEICKQLGIHVEAGFMLYDPYTTINEIRQNLRFLDETRVFDLPNLLARMEVRAGMPMEEQLRREEKLKGSYRDLDYEMPDPRAEIFHDGICQVLEPLVPVYLKFRDLKHMSGLPSETIGLAQERLNLKALRLAQQLVDAVTDVRSEDSKAVENAVQWLEKQAEQEADRLWRVAWFFGQGSEQSILPERESVRVL